VSLLPLILGPRTYPLLLLGTVLIGVHSLRSRGPLALHGLADHSMHALYAANVAIFSSATAGAIVVGALVSALAIERARPVVRIAEVTALAGLAMTALFVVADTGRPERLMQLGHDLRTSPLTVWDLAILSLYLGNAIPLGYVVSRPHFLRDLGRLQSRPAFRHLATFVPSALTGVGTAQGRGALWELARVFVPVAVLVHSTGAWVLGLATDDPGWLAVLFAAPFYFSSVICGLALVTVGVTLPGAPTVVEDVIKSLGRALFFSVPILGYCFFGEMRMIIDAREPGSGHLVRELALGSYAPLFWFVMVGGVIAPFALLSTPRSVVGRTRLAALLVVLAVLVERWTITIASFLGHAHGFYTDGGYAPTRPEVSFTLAVYGTALLSCLVVLRWRHRARAHDQR
jgi:dimethyl sulfoxide reductase membrane subunit